MPQETSRAPDALTLFIQAQLENPTPTNEAALIAALKAYKEVSNSAVEMPLPSHHSSRV